MERIGDQAADISELTILMSKTQYIKRLDHIEQMAKATIEMVTTSVMPLLREIWSLLVQFLQEMIL